MYHRVHSQKLDAPIPFDAKPNMILFVLWALCNITVVLSTYGALRRSPLRSVSALMWSVLTVTMVYQHCRRLGISLLVLKILLGVQQFVLVTLATAVVALINQLGHMGATFIILAYFILIQCLIYMVHPKF